MYDPEDASIAMVVDRPMAVAVTATLRMTVGMIVGVGVIIRVGVVAMM